MSALNPPRLLKSDMYGVFSTATSSPLKSLNCTTALIRARAELRFNDRFGCPRRAMCAWLMSSAFRNRAHNKRHLLEKEICSKIQAAFCTQCDTLVKKHYYWHYITPSQTSVRRLTGEFPSCTPIKRDRIIWFMKPFIVIWHLSVNGSSNLSDLSGDKSFDN